MAWSAIRGATPLALIIALLAAPWTVAGADEDGRNAEQRASAKGVCADQIRRFVAERFGQTVREIEFRWQEPKTRDNVWNLSQALAYVQECPGYHYFEINGGFYRCVGQAHLGKVPDYVMYRSSGDGC